jgi:hypothetical protein
MRVYMAENRLFVNATSLGFAILLAISASGAFGANVFNAGGGTQFWFNPMNWSAGNLPPNSTTVGTVTDTGIDQGTSALPGGEGVVYDPANDPGFAAALTATYPAGFGAQNIQQFYIGRYVASTPTPTANNLLTIKGDLTVSGTAFIVGRSSGVDGVATNATIVQTGGVLKTTAEPVDLGGADTSQAGIGNGTYDYRGGSLELGTDPVTGGGAGLRLSNGSNTVNAITTLPTGASGIGKIIMHNPATGGHFHVRALQFAAYAGVVDGVTTAQDPNGVTTGVGIAEFHYENGNTRPIQVDGNLSLNNGTDAATPCTSCGTRSSRLALDLDAAPILTAGVPQNLGLFDVDASTADLTVGAIAGSGTLAKTFNSADGSVNYPEGATVSAVFGSTTYNWKISYSGNITWTDQDNSVVSTITGMGTGTDVVLMGLSSVSNGVPGDYNNNGVVDAADYTIWRSQLGQPSTLPNRDSTNSGAVNAQDYTFWKSHFGNHAGPGAGLGAGAAVPEPSTLMLAVFGLICAVSTRRRLS